MSSVNQNFFDFEEVNSDEATSANNSIEISADHFVPNSDMENQNELLNDGCQTPVHQMRSSISTVDEVECRTPAGIAFQIQPSTECPGAPRKKAPEVVSRVPSEKMRRLLKPMNLDSQFKNQDTQRNFVF